MSKQNEKPRDGEGVSSKGWREQFGLPSGGGSGPPPGGGEEVPQMMEVGMMGRLERKKGMKQMKTLSL